MEDLIKALQIFMKYREDKNERHPTNCVHDYFLVMDITYEEVSKEDKEELDKLGFEWNGEFGCWGSYRFGNA